MYNKSFYTSLKNYRYQISSNINTIQSQENYNIKYEDNIIIGEKLKNFLGLPKDEDSLINIYRYLTDYLNKNKLINNKEIILDEKLKDLFDLKDNRDNKLNIINLGIYLNKLLVI